jgi:hypothetical protein
MDNIAEEKKFNISEIQKHIEWLKPENIKSEYKESKKLLVIFTTIAKNTKI